MQTEETIKISGVFHCKIFKNGELIEEYTDNNVVVNNAKIKIANSLISTSIPGVSKIGLGTSNTAPSVTDSSLTGLFTKTIVSATNITNGAEFNWQILTSEANGFTYQEFGLMFSDGSLFARKTGITIAKNSTISITGKWTITIT